MILLPLLASVVLACTPPTSNTDGSALKTPISYKFQMGTTAGSYPNSSPPQALCGYTWPNLGAGTYFFVATAIDSAGAQSPASNQASKTIVGVPPTPVTIGGPVLSLQITKNSIVAPQIGSVVAGKPCDVSQAFIFGGATYMRTDTANVTPIGNVDLSQTATWAQCQ